MEPRWHAMRTLGWTCPVVCGLANLSFPAWGASPWSTRRCQRSPCLCYRGSRVTLAHAHTHIRTPTHSPTHTRRRARRRARKRARTSTRTHSANFTNHVQHKNNSHHATHKQQHTKQQHMHTRSHKIYMQHTTHTLRDSLHTCAT